MSKNEFEKSFHKALNATKRDRKYSKAMGYTPDLSTLKRIFKNLQDTQKELEKMEFDPESSAHHYHDEANGYLKVVINEMDNLIEEVGRQ